MQWTSAQRDSKRKCSFTFSGKNTASSVVSAVAWAAQHAVTAAAVQVVTVTASKHAAAAAAVQAKTAVAQHSKHAVTAVAQNAVIAVKVILKELLKQ